MSSVESKVRSSLSKHGISMLNPNLSKECFICKGADEIDWANKSKIFEDVKSDLIDQGIRLVSLRLIGREGLTYHRTKWVFDLI